MIKILILLLIILIIIRTSKSTFSNNSKELYFIHIPKNAGSTIEDLFKKNGYLVGKFGDINDNNSNNIIKCSNWHIPPKYNSTINFKDYFTTFCVIRDPFDRFISEMNYFNNGNNGDINEYIINNLIKNSNKFINDCHLIPQSEYLYDYYGNKVENIIHFENLDQDLNNFIKKYNLGIEYNGEKENVSNKRYSMSDFNEESIKIIKEYYKEDFIISTCTGTIF